MIFATADWHLLKPLRDNVKALADDSQDMLRQLVDGVLAYPAAGETKHLVLAGDICDKSRIDGRTADALRAAMDRLNKEGVRIYYIEGNHDVQSDFISRPVPLLESVARCAVKLVPQEPVMIDDLTVCGISWAPGDRMAEALKTVPRSCTMLVMHAPFEHLLGFEGAYEFSESDIPDHVWHVVCGDIHTPKLSQFGELTFLSPGCLNPCNVTETGPYGFWVRPAGGAWTMTRLNARQIMTVKAEDLTDEPTFTARVREVKAAAKAGKTPVVVIKGVQPDLAVLVRFQAELRNDAILLDQATTVAMAEVTLGQPEDVKFDRLTMREALPLVLDKAKEPEVFELLDTLLSTTENHAAVLGQMVEKLKTAAVS